MFDTAPICEHNAHICPRCKAGEPCMDLFQDQECGLVACTADAPFLAVVPDD
jgi:hypothetical protein